MFVKYSNGNVYRCLGELGFEGEFPYAFNVGDHGVGLRLFVGESARIEGECFVELTVDTFDEVREDWFWIGDGSLHGFDRFGETSRGTVSLDEFHERYDNCDKSVELQGGSDDE